MRPIFQTPQSHIDARRRQSIIMSINRTMPIVSRRRQEPGIRNQGRPSKMLLRRRGRYGGQWHVTKMRKGLAAIWKNNSHSCKRGENSWKHESSPWATRAEDRIEGRWRGPKEGHIYGINIGQGELWDARPFHVKGQIDRIYLYLANTASQGLSKKGNEGKIPCDCAVIVLVIIITDVEKKQISGARASSRKISKFGNWEFPGKSYVIPKFKCSYNIPKYDFLEVYNCSEDKLLSRKQHT